MSGPRHHPAQLSGRLSGTRRPGDAERDAAAGVRPDGSRRATAARDSVRRGDAMNDSQRGNKSMRFLIMTVINVILVNVRRVSVNERQRGSDGHA